ncbi:MAG: hypothetical protein GX060_05635 [Firmicutes bacterium]|nr:hypothetical protein [Bacillota bacterium]
MTLVGALVVLSPANQAAFIDHSGEMHIMVTDDWGEVATAIQELAPDVLIMDSYHASNRELVYAYRAQIPWGYTVVLLLAAADLDLIELLKKNNIDEFLPCSTFSTAQVRLLTRLAKLNQYWQEGKARCRAQGPNGECQGECSQGFEDFFQGRRFLSPSMWARKSLGQWTFLFQHIAQMLGLAGISAWPNFNQTVANLGSPGEPPVDKVDMVIAKLAMDDIQVTWLPNQSAWLLSLLIEGAFFPQAIFQYGEQTVLMADKVAESSHQFASNKEDELPRGDSLLDFLAIGINTIARIQVREYTIGLHSYRQCVLCREAARAGAYRDAISDAASLGVLLLNSERNVLAASDIAVSLLAECGTVADLSLDRLPYLNDLLDRIDSGDSDEGPMLVTINGKQIAVSAAAATDPSGEHIGYAVTLRDETETLRLQEEARFREKLALVGELAAGMAHEVRNPLTSIRGFIQLLRQRLLDSSYGLDVQFADYILEEIDRANHVVTNFLTLAKPQSEAWCEVDLNELLTEILQLVSNQAALKGVDLTWQLAPDLPPIRAKREALVQVFLNMVTNALQATPKGGSVHIITRQANEHVLVVIEDTGIGMPESVQKRIFEPFYSTREGGTGLGLSLCRQIVAEHRGRIKLESAVGKGSCFTVWLPPY